MSAVFAEVEDPFQQVIDALSAGGISLSAGVNGGGIARLAQHMAPHDAWSPDAAHDTPPAIRFLTLGEYAAGFVPLGYYLAGGGFSAAMATTGAAIKLITCGMTDAKLHSLPALYIVALSPRKNSGFNPLQDTSSQGMNALAQLEAELPGSIFIVDDPQTTASQIAKACAVLRRKRPAILALDPESLTRLARPRPRRASPLPQRCRAMANTKMSPAVSRVDWQLDSLNHRRVVMLVGAGLPPSDAVRRHTTALADLLGAAVLYSINGANAVSRHNPYLHGYLGFGGNCAATKIWDGMDDETVLLALGSDFDEYTTGMAPLKCGSAWILGADALAYGAIGGSLQHLTSGDCLEVAGEPEQLLADMLEAVESQRPRTLRYPPAPVDLNDVPLAPSRAGYVDCAAFYQHIDTLWRPGSIGFDDICMAYKERQYVTQRPNADCPFFSLYRGSAMGGAYGLAIGAKLAAPEKTVFAFTGDGCLRLYAGNLAEARELGINIFLLNNGVYGIVKHGLGKLFPTLPEDRRHTRLQELDYRALMAGYGWDYAYVDADLANLGQILDRCYRRGCRSMLIEMRLDPEQDLGPNPRVRGL